MKQPQFAFQYCILRIKLNTRGGVFFATNFQKRFRVTQHQRWNVCVPYRLVTWLKKFCVASLMPHSEERNVALQNVLKKFLRIRCLCNKKEFCSWSNKSSKHEVDFCLVLVVPERLSNLVSKNNPPPFVQFNSQNAITLPNLLRSKLGNISFSCRK